MQVFLDVSVVAGLSAVRTVIVCCAVTDGTVGGFSHYANF